MSRTLAVGVIGCGNISTSYFDLAPLFQGFEMVACADLNAELAQQRAQKYGLQAMSVTEMLASSEIDLIVNLTIPAAHYQVSLQAIEAGKHVYSEKPLVLNLEDGLNLKRVAEERNVRVGSAPDTFLGGAHQLARHLIDSGKVADIVSGTCHVMSPGMESWHPNPDFFFKAGGGPILDLGPYYIANLIQLLGPVASVIASASIPSKQRRITSQPRYGELIDVETPTTIHAVLTFQNGALITLGASWDVQTHEHAPIELYGQQGSLTLPDPNFFGGALTLTQGEQVIPVSESWEHPFGKANQIHGDLALANYRTVGLAEMVQAIHSGQEHMCSLDRALHGVEVMTGILTSAQTDERVSLITSCERPRALDPAAAQSLLKQTTRGN